MLQKRGKREGKEADRMTKEMREKIKKRYRAKRIRIRDCDRLTEGTK